jgi:hypothetical protein
MKTIIFRNNRETTVRVTLEPWAELYDVPAQTEICLHCELKEGEIDFEIDIEESNMIGLWVPFGTRLFVDGQALDKL